MGYQFDGRLSRRAVHWAFAAISENPRRSRLSASGLSARNIRDSFCRESASGVLEIPCFFLPSQSASICLRDFVEISDQFGGELSSPSERRSLVTSNTFCILSSMLGCGGSRSLASLVTEDRSRSIVGSIAVDCCLQDLSFRTEMNLDAVWPAENAAEISQQSAFADFLANGNSKSGKTPSPSSLASQLEYGQRASKRGLTIANGTSTTVKSGSESRSWSSSRSVAPVFQALEPMAHQRAHVVFSVRCCVRLRREVPSGFESTPKVHLKSTSGLQDPTATRAQPPRASLAPHCR